MAMFFDARGKMAARTSSFPAEGVPIAASRLTSGCHGYRGSEAVRKFGIGIERKK